MDLNITIKSENDDVSVGFNQSKIDTAHDTVWISFLDNNGEHFDAPYRLADFLKVVEALSL